MHFIRFLKKHSTVLLVIVVLVSIALTIVNWNTMSEARQRLSSIVWTGPALLMTELMFIVGAVMMAMSAGEELSTYRHPRHWHHGIRALRQNTRRFAENLIISPLFEIGFWLNFVGAIGTSVIIIAGLIIVAPYTGLGITIIVFIDLIATFGWRVPLEIARRKVKKHVKDHGTSGDRL